MGTAETAEKASEGKIMQCEKPNQIRAKTATGTKYFRRVRCRYCLPCRLTRQYGIANRLQYDIKRYGADRCWFFTGTFRDRGKGFPDELCLPYSTPTAVGELTDRQVKAYMKLLKIVDKSKNPEHIEWATKLMREMQRAQPARPTVSREVMINWRHRVRYHCGGKLPRILYNGEYGSKTGRPHDHAILLDLDASQAQAIIDVWPYSDEIKEIQPLQSDLIGSYVAKDVVKGSPQVLSYIASGREPPFMGYPRTPYLAQGQEEDIYKQLRTTQKHVSALRFEECVQLEHLGRTFKMRSGEGNRKVIHVPHGETAYRKALARIERDEKAKAIVAAEAARNAHLTVTHTTEGHPHYCEEHHEHFKKQCLDAERRSARAAQNHRAILHRKGIRG